MELKVWVEGLQRVVCGVTQATTCQDVVMALAQATGKTGRFTLLEKWHEIERPLAPSDNPLRILHKWGEYANDVQFILRHSDTRSRSDRTGERSAPGQKDSATPQQRESVRPSSASAAVKRSLTFSGGYSLQPLSLQRPGESGVPHHSYSSLERKPPKSFQGERGAVMRGSLDRYRSGVNTQSDSNLSHQGPTTTSLAHQSVSASNLSRKSPGSTPTNSLDRRRRIARQSPIKDKPEPSAATSSNLVARVAPSDPAKPDSPRDILPPGQEGGTAPTEKRVLGGSREELLKLVSLQLERLELQEKHMNQLQSEICYLEEQDAALERDTAAVSSELTRLEAQERELDAQLQELQLVSWEDKLRLEEVRSEQLHKDVATYQQRINSCESQLQETRDKLLQLGKELENNLSLQEQERRGKEKEEEKVRQEILQLKSQLASKEKEGSITETTLNEVQGQLEKLEASITQQKVQITRLEEELKETNLDTFKLETGAEIVRAARERRSATDLLSSHRQGNTTPSLSVSMTTTRSRPIIFNAQTLKEAVSVADDPDMLWV